MSSQPDPTDRFVGQAIKARRRAGAMTQKDLAAAIGVGFQQVQKYERGENRVSASVIARIARTLGCGVADFFPGPEGPASGTGTLELSRDDSELLALFRSLALSRKALLLDVARQFSALERQPLIEG